MNGKLVLVISLMILSGCTTNPSGGYLTWNDPIQHKCIDGKLWAVNNSGKVDLEEQCNSEESKD